MGIPGLFIADPEEMVFACCAWEPLTSSATRAAASAVDDFPFMPFSDALDPAGAVSWRFICGRPSDACRGEPMFGLDPARPVPALNRGGADGVSGE